MNSTQAWVTYLSKVELPVLANTLRRIDELTDNRNSTVNELANVILNDAQLTSQVLRLSNTVFYNQTRTQVSTVSRAITLIGFDAVKSMAISSLIVDTLLQRNDRPHLLRCLARAIHAAVQARCLMPKRSETALEEVFIGALLMNIGELAFWSCETEQATELEERLRLDEPLRWRRRRRYCTQPLPKLPVGWWRPGLWDRSSGTWFRPASPTPWLPVLCVIPWRWPGCLNRAGADRR